MAEAKTYFEIMKDRGHMTHPAATGAPAPAPEAAAPAEGDGAEGQTPATPNPPAETE